MKLTGILMNRIKMFYKKETCSTSNIHEDIGFFTLAETTKQNSV